MPSNIAREVAPFFKDCTIQNVQFVFLMQCGEMKYNFLIEIKHSTLGFMFFKKVENTKHLSWGQPHVEVAPQFHWGSRGLPRENFNLGCPEIKVYLK